MKQYKVKSETAKDGFYFVRLTDTGWRCNCPDFVLRKSKLGLHCKHVEKVLKGINGRLLKTGSSRKD